MNIQELHEKVLYPIVRVRTEKAGGSGSIIYSAEDPEHEGDYLTFVLTNWHVIEDAISYADEWDSLLKRKRKKETLSQVSVEIFDYVRLSEVVSSNVHRADIVAYDKAHDLAVLKLDSPKRYANVAKIVDRKAIKDIKLFTPVRGAGCSLGHYPFSTEGELTFLKEIIKDKLFWMTSANSIFGNSGGAVFLAETGEQIGVTARVTGIQLGFGVDIITWMSFCVPAPRIYEFFDEQELRFLYDEDDTYAAALERRDKEQKKALLDLLGQDEGEDKDK